MAELTDSDLGIEYSRKRSRVSRKRFVAQFIEAEDAALAEPIIFDVLRHALRGEVEQLEELFDLMPALESRGDFWRRAATLGQACRHRGITAGALDLLIGTVALYHSAEIVTFDQRFQDMARVCDLKIKLLQRPNVTE